MKGCLDDKREFAEMRARLGSSLNRSHAPESSWYSPKGLQHRQCLPFIFYVKDGNSVLLKLHGKRKPCCCDEWLEQAYRIVSWRRTQPICSRACLPLHVQKRCEGRQALRNVNSSEELLHLKEDEQVVNFMTQMVRDRYRAGSATRRNFCI
jgi:hypothetical protein